MLYPFYRISCHGNLTFPATKLDVPRIERGLGWRHRRFDVNTWASVILAIHISPQFVQLLIPIGGSTAAATAARRIRDERLVADTRPACLHAHSPSSPHVHGLLTSPCCRVASPPVDMRSCGHENDSDRQPEGRRRKNHRCGAFGYSRSRRWPRRSAHRPGPSGHCGELGGSSAEPTPRRL